MFRSFDLALYSSNANQMLNDPCLRLLSLKIHCSAETGYTSAALRFSPCPKREIKFKRYLRRFVVEQQEPELDELLQDKKNRIIKQHIFPTAEGLIVVVDYQVRNRKAGRS